jgi:(E)-4-hydroxy-3-methylbut-2-enyl-diphosphate synthase
LSSVTPPTATASKLLLFTPDLFRYHRRKTRTVMVGDVGVGGHNPIRLQSMTTTPTTDVDATVAQSIRMIEAGCEIVRITAPTMADARALGEIRKELDQKGFKKVPLVADIHFNPECAMEAANHVEKVRVNPGNYADSKAFKTKGYTDAEYDEALERIEERFTPLVLKCKKLGRSMRVGCNHGSLSDRIMNRYGDTPLGMVEAALEFVRIGRKHHYFDIILSMKASNPKVMIEAYRFLAARMDEESMDYPLHLGVTEAGYGEDGRIKSAIGIGSLLNDGLGDTIRVSLTEDPEFEIPVAQQITEIVGAGHRACPQSNSNESQSNSDRGRGQCPAPTMSHVPDLYTYSRRPTLELAVGPFKLGGENTVRVISDFSPWLGEARTGKAAAAKILGLLEGQRKSGKEMVPEILEWTISSRQDLEYLRHCRQALGAETSRLGFFGRFSDLALAKEGLKDIHLALFTAPRTIPDAERLDQLRSFVRAAKEACVPILLESGPCHRGPLNPARNLLRGIEICEKEGHCNLLLSFNLPTVQEVIANARLAAALLRKGSDPERGLTPAVSYPFHLRFPGRELLEDERIEASIAFGSLLCDGIGDSVQTGQGVTPTKDLELVYNILQGAGVRITKTEFVSCPSCGRTLFDLQTVTERIKKKTGHLKGVKIAIMGCIVNGPGEMADADFGYVGGASGKINLYVGKTCVEKGISFDEADDRLIQLIKSRGKWVEPK